VIPPTSKTVPQAVFESPPLLSEVLSEEEIAALKFKPPSPGMGSRRNDRRTMRGDRTRARRPLVTLS
jgi:hypothetical protein